MIGLGFLIWQMAEIKKHVTPAQLVDLCLQVGVKWLSCKVANGELLYNTGYDDYFTALRSAGIEIGGWPYCYPYPPARPEVQADLYEKRIRDLQLSHLMLDVETEWKVPGLGIQIDKICKIETDIPVGLCSYRFPALHGELDWKRWLGQTKISFVAPQVYWEGSHNAGAQLIRSHAQYRKLTNAAYIPIGCTYGRGVWEPTEADLCEFIQVAHELNCVAYGFYSLDWVLKHKKYDWLSAISNTVISQPPVVQPPVKPPGPPIQPPVVIGKAQEYQVATDPEVWRKLFGKKKFVSWRSKKPVPMINHFMDDTSTDLTEAWQRLIMAMNPGMTGAGFASLLKHDRAVSNHGAGLGNDNDPRADFINRKNLGAPLPRIGKQYVFGGATLRGKLSNGILTVETLDGSKKPPSADWIMARPWLYYACITIRPDGISGVFPQRGGLPVYLPLVVTGVARARFDAPVWGKPFPWVTRKV